MKILSSILLFLSLDEPIAHRLANAEGPKRRNCKVAGGVVAYLAGVPHALRQYGKLPYLNCISIHLKIYFLIFYSCIFITLSSWVGCFSLHLLTNLFSGRAKNAFMVVEECECIQDVSCCLSQEDVANFMLKLSQNKDYLRKAVAIADPLPQIFDNDKQDELPKNASTQCETTGSG